MFIQFSETLQKPSSMIIINFRKCMHMHTYTNYMIRLFLSLSLNGVKLCNLTR